MGGLELDLSDRMTEIRLAPLLTSVIKQTSARTEAKMPFSHDRHLSAQSKVWSMSAVCKKRLECQLLTSSQT